MSDDTPGYRAEIWLYPLAEDGSEGAPIRARLGTGAAPQALPASDVPETDAEPAGPKPVVILFSDDSTLFFALRMRDVLRNSAEAPPVDLVWYTGENALSFRQMAQLLPEGPAYSLGPKQLSALAGSDTVRAIITSRVYRALGDAIKSVPFRMGAGRPCVISFLGGLDFFPQNGFARRRNCDGVYLFPTSNIEAYREAALEWDDAWKEVGFGHPSFLRPEDPPADLASRRDIFFFTQALSPSTKRGRMHMLQALAAMARANPDHTVWIKLRHLPNENQKHLHLERYHYPGLLEELDNPPPNLKLTACTMDEALATAALGITCTSTAAIDVVRAGIPAMVHLDFIDNYRDPLVEPMRKLFRGSNLITPLGDMLEKRAQAPDPAWVEKMLCPRDLGDRVMQTVARFETRPFQITEAPR